MLRRLKHGALNFYINGYITPKKCAVWLEFCDRGSLKDIIKAYAAKRSAAAPSETKPHMPEKWLWHCFIGLCDALAYLRTGLSFLSDGIKDPKKKDPNWTPILHRDIKPDNILLRSRTVSGHRKYFYVVLSDFGLACEELPKNDPKANLHHTMGVLCGTPFWCAPELCHDPWTLQTEMYFPDKKGHTEKSDLWALGTLIFVMAECDNNAHVRLDRRYEAPPGAEIGFSRRMLKLVRNIKAYYSDPLRESIMRAANSRPADRPTPMKLVIEMSQLVQKVFPESEPTPEEMLPEWATRKHDYHSRAVMKPEELGKK